MDRSRTVDLIGRRRPGVLDRIIEWGVCFCYGGAVAPTPFLT